jgi:hypothetical protein
MQMGAGDAAAFSDQPDALSGADSLTLMDVGPAQMEVRGHHSRTMIDIDGPSRQIEISNQGNNPVTCSLHRCSYGARKVGPEMAALDFSIVYPCGSKPAGNPAAPRQDKLPPPQLGALM